MENKSANSCGKTTLLYYILQIKIIKQNFKAGLKHVVIYYNSPSVNIRHKSSLYTNPMLINS